MIAAYATTGAQNRAIYCSDLRGGMSIFKLQAVHQSSSTCTDTAVLCMFVPHAASMPASDFGIGTLARVLTSAHHTL
jgi:hypothetical protein